MLDSTCVYSLSIIINLLCFQSWHVIILKFSTVNVKNNFLNIFEDGIDFLNITNCCKIAEDLIEFTEINSQI